MPGGARTARAAEVPPECNEYHDLADLRDGPDPFDYIKQVTVVRACCFGEDVPCPGGQDNPVKLRQVAERLGGLGGLGGAYADHRMAIESRIMWVDDSGYPNRSPGHQPAHAVAGASL